MTDGHSELRRRWFEAAADPAVSDALEAIYIDVADRISQRGPACWASGRCCHFEATGHRLYVTGLEAAWCVARTHVPSVHEIDVARSRGGCPFQTGHLCGVHDARPLGCRVYFCDRSSTLWQQALSESALESVREVHKVHEIPYRYAEWRSMLDLLASE